MKQIFDKKIISVTLIALSVLFFILIMTSKGKNLDNFVFISIVISIIFLILASISSFLMAAINMMLNPKSLKKILIVTGIMALLLIIGYALDDKTVNSNWGDKVTTASQSGWIGGSLIATWILLILSIVAAVGSAIYSSVKKV